MGRQPAGDHQRPNGPVLTPRSAGHVIPSVVTSPDYRREHGLELGLTISRPRPSPHGRALIDRRPYLPAKTWCADGARCAAVGIPADVEFATKPALAAEMVDAALDAAVPASLAAADEVYGAKTVLRAGPRARGVGYVLAVACNQHVVTSPERVRMDVHTGELPRHAWQRRSAGDGSKGPATTTGPGSGSTGPGVRRGRPVAADPPPPAHR
ncbi:MAG: hypothetical protein GEV09_00100 [Pseudonocardiaceae bacterium]|nr:hypothetical protein [Pseudonocardiaceae bacterium]